MATIDSHEASPSTSPWSYRVYLSFNGSDTCDTFIDHLCKDLVHHELHPFRDADEQLERGREDIKPILRKAIEESRVSIIVLSKNYVSSRQCLDRLAMILKCRSLEHVVLPVFYGMDASEVRDHNGKFKEAFEWHEMKIGVAMGEQEAYWTDKVQEWRQALEQVANFPGYEFQKAFHRENEIVQRICFTIIGCIAKSNSAQLGRPDRCDFSASHPKEETTREKRKKRETYSYDFSSDALQQFFGRKREDVAKSLDISVSTLKRICRSHGITRWPNRKRSSVSGLPSPHGEKTPLPTFDTLSTNGQIRMENEVGGQNSEPNECLPDSFEDPNLQNTGNGSIEDFRRTPTCYDSLPDHYRDTNICVSALYSETEAAKGSSEGVFPPEVQTTQSTAHPNSNGLLFQRPHWTLEDMRDSLASQAEEGHGSESSNLTVPALSERAFQLEHQSTQFPDFPNLTGLVDPHPQVTSTEILWDYEDEPFMVEDFFRPYMYSPPDQFCPPTLHPKPSLKPCPLPPRKRDTSQPLGTIRQPMCAIFPMVPHPVGGSSEVRDGRMYPDLSGLVDPHPQIASAETYLCGFEYCGEPVVAQHGFEVRDGRMYPELPPTPRKRDTYYMSAPLGQHAFKLRVSFATGIIQLKKQVSKRLTCFRPKEKKMEKIELRAC